MTAFSHCGETARPMAAGWAHLDAELVRAPAVRTGIRL